MKGVVQTGQKKGREFGFPTANIVNVELVAPGIYAAKALLGESFYNAAVYVGAPRPEVLEVHLIDFDADIYGKEIEVSIIKKIRDDMYEPDFELLKKKIAHDIGEVKKCFLE